MAVRWCADHGFSADIATSAWSILDDERLAKPFG